MFRLMVAMGLIAGLGGCAAKTDLSCAPGVGSPVAVFTLFMGESIPNRGDLTEAEWQTFLDDTITAALPNGFTVFDATGGWMNPVTHKTIRENTKVLLVALPAAPASLTAINRIRTAYQMRFQQQLVGMTVQQGCATF